MAASTAKEYPKNINLYVPPWLHYFLLIFSIVNLSLAVSTIVFQLRNPKSRRNMGRFFLLILGLQTIDKAHLFLQELLFQDLSLVFYEVKYEIQPRSLETKLCTYFGTIRNCVGFLSQLYCLWLAVLIKQILKDPIHRLNRYIYFYHALTIIVSMGFTGIMHTTNNFGVEETLQCGINNSPGLADEFIMMLPLLLVPFQLFLIVKIMRQTPYIVRLSLRRFVAKYIFFTFFMVAQQGMQVSLIIYGSRKPYYYTYNHEDGYKRLRFAYLMMDKVTFLCLATCTLCERVFFDKCIALYKFFFLRNRRMLKKKQALIDVQQKRGTKGEGQVIENSVEFEQLSNPPAMSMNNSLSSDDDDNFEDGDNCVIVKREEVDIEDESKFEKFVEENDSTSRDTNSLQSRTNYFIINAVLISICNCVLLNKKKENQNVVGVMTGLVQFAQKLITYQLKDDDLNHIIDMAQFYQNNKEICASDVTNGKKVQIKITEYGPDMLRTIRRQSGYSDEFLIKSFAPFENQTEMAQFQEGSGKSASFFFFTSNKQFVIKTLKEEELDLLAKRGVLEKYYNYITKNPKSLLARFYCILTVKIKYMRPINVIIMDNLMGEHIEHVLRVYDLKGSTFQRINNKPSSDRSVRKDLNFLDDREYRMHVRHSLKKDILKMMQKDKEFLKSCQLMDYSLLIIFFKKDEWDPEDEQISSHDNSHRSNSKHKLSIFIQKDENGNVMIQEGHDDEDHSKNNAQSCRSKSHWGDQDIKPKNPNHLENSIEFDNLLSGDPKRTKMTMPLKKFSTSQIGAFTSKATMIRNAAKNFKSDAVVLTVQPNHTPLQPRTNKFIQYRSTQDKLVYYRIGIIDFLQKYNRRKQMETKWLTFRNRNVSPDTFSCVDPKLYGDRFYNFMKTNLFDECDLKIIEDNGELEEQE